MYKTLHDRLVLPLIPPKLKESPYTFRKARVLTYIHLFCLSLGIVLALISAFLQPENDLPLFSSIILLAVFIYIFRKLGNLALSGNLLALVWVLALIGAVGETGGIYSDNLLWLVIAPMLAFLFASRWSGILWSVLLLGITGYYFYLDKMTPDFFRPLTHHFDGNYYFVSYFSLFIALLGIIIIFKKGKEDIISMLQAQQKILQAQKKEITAQAEALKQVENKLRISNKELEHFASVASHDLKEPLRMIDAYTRLIQKRLDDQLDDRTTEYMFFVTDGVARMTKLLNELLEYSRLGRNKYKNKKMNDLNDILMIVMSNLMIQMEETQTSIYSSRLPQLYSVSTEMTQLFQNIIANGIKFRREAVAPRIDVEATDQEENVLISIKDNGIGIAKENQEKVFAIFERIHTKTEFEGHGIGLATCKKIVSNMNGRIWLNSEPGEGTTFFMSFPKTTVVEVET